MQSLNHTQSSAHSNPGIAAPTPTWMLTVLLVFAGIPFSVAQNPKEWEKDGGIPSTEIEIVVDHKVKLPPADRNFQKIAPRPAEPVRHDITYDYKNLKFNTSDYSP